MLPGATLPAAGLRHARPAPAIMCRAAAGAPEAASAGCGGGPGSGDGDPGGGRTPQAPGRASRAGLGSWRAGRCRAQRLRARRGQRSTWQRPGWRRRRGRCGRGRGWGWRRRCCPRRCWMRRWPGCPARRARKIAPRLAMQIELARALMGGTAAGRCALWRSGPGKLTRDMTCPRRRRCRTRTASSGQAAGGPARRLCGQVRPVPLPVSRRRASRRPGRRTASDSDPAAACRAAGGPWSSGAGTGCGAGQGRHRPRRR